MAKSRKKKKTQARPSMRRDAEVTKSFFDKFSVVARKTLQLLELDPALYDKFTKKQKIEMMQTKFAPPHFEAKPGHRVPRHYIREVQKRSTEFMEHVFIGDPDLKLTFYDYLTMGSQFGTYCMAIYEEKQYCEQAEVYKTIADQVILLEDFGKNTLMKDYLEFLRQLLGHLSQFNYRMYGFYLTFKQTRTRVMMAHYIQITSIECEKKAFIFHDKKRPAFRMLMPNFIESEVNYVNIPINRVFENSTPDKLLKLYIQSHALFRMKERLDTFTVYEKNLYLIHSVYTGGKVRLSSGREAFEMLDGENQIIAYLPFMVQDDCVLILTVLPVTNPTTPIGKKLCETLGVSRTELDMCGMDRLSYFLGTDFDKIPRLKQALESNNLMYLTKDLSLYESDKIIERTPGISASIFQTERTHEEVLSEIGEMY
jgi:hypothetical protein